MISGEAKKMLLSTKFSITLQPVEVSGRKLSFNMVEMKPLNNEWIKQKIFNKLHSMVYNNGILTIDLNEIEKIRKIPVGKINKFEIKDKILWCTLGL